jgi:hypothetical protein
MTFSTRMVVEKLVCDRSVHGRDASDAYVRIMVNSSLSEPDDIRF